MRRDRDKNMFVLYYAMGAVIKPGCVQASFQLESLCFRNECYPPPPRRKAARCVSIKLYSSKILSSSSKLPPTLVRMLEPQKSDGGHLLLPRSVDGHLYIMHYHDDNSKLKSVWNVGQSFWSSLSPRQECDNHFRTCRLFNSNIVRLATKMARKMSYPLQIAG